MRLEYFLESNALRWAEKPALVVAGQRVCFRELWAASLRLAHGLRRLGVRPGDRVLVNLPNGAEFVQSLYASFALGAIVVPVNTRMTPKEIAYLAGDCRPSVFIHHRGLLASLVGFEAELKQVKRVLLGYAPDEDCPGLHFELASAPCNDALGAVPLEAEDCMILYTSGTTGQPKGALITHANLIVQHAFINAIDWQINADDVYLVTTSLAHRTGLARMINAICLGGTLVVMDRFEPERALDLIEREHVTAVGMVPTVARMLLPALSTRAASCASLRHLIVTGEAFPVEVKQRLAQLMPHVKQHSFFAMTEVGSVTSLHHDEQLTHPTSVGRVTPGVEVKLIDEQGAEVALGEPGELLVRSGPPGRFTTMRGYFERPQETAATLIDGWLKTGDMARFDDDGYLYIVDRKKDMVLTGGFNVYTKEIEQMLVEHPAIEDAAVVGAPDPIYGEAVVAFIELKPGASLSAEDVIEHSRSRVAGYKKPKLVHFVDALPRNAMGKVLKAELRQRLAALQQT